jgi:hypothetical protein
MAKYRKKYILVDPIQWFKDGDHPKVRKTSYAEISTLLGTSGCSKEEPYWDWQAMGIIESLECNYAVCPGDWIAKGPKGEYYAIKPDIFEATYEKVEQ